MRLMDIRKEIIDSSNEGVVLQCLWDLMAEAVPSETISHNEMPEWEDHCMFVRRAPYDFWYLIFVHDVVIGTIYLTDRSEIGIRIFKHSQGKGYGPAAINMLIDAHPRERYLANINPANERSIGMFDRLGFTHIQNTYELRC